MSACADTCAASSVLADTLARCFDQRQTNCLMRKKVNCLMLLPISCRARGIDMDEQDALVSDHLKQLQQLASKLQEGAGEIDTMHKWGHKLLAVDCVQIDHAAVAPLEPGDCQCAWLTALKQQSELYSRLDPISHVRNCLPHCQVVGLKRLPCDTVTESHGRSRPYGLDQLLRKYVCVVLTWPDLML